jgi:hypothetical protein
MLTSPIQFTPFFLYRRPLADTAFGIPTKWIPVRHCPLETAHRPRLTVPIVRAKVVKIAYMRCIKNNNTIYSLFNIFYRIMLLRIYRNSSHNTDFQFGDLVRVSLPV